MGLELRQLHPLFAAEATGVDLSGTVDGAVVDAIWRAIDEYAVVVFRDQRLDDTQLRDFAALFGPLEIGRAAATAKRRRLKHPEIGDISNLDEDGKLRDPYDRRRLDMLGNRLWHTDASYMPVPVVLGMLHAVAVPPASALGGGETEFGDMRAAYDALPDAMKAAIDPLVAEHDIFWSRGQIGFTEFGPGEREKYPPSRQRLVRRHPGSGRKTRLSVGARLAYRRLAGGRRPHPALRPQFARDPAGVCLQPPMADGRSGDLGQSLHDASRPPARRNPAARPAPRDDPRHRLDPAGGRINSRRLPEFGLLRRSRQAWANAGQGW